MTAIAAGAPTRASLAAAVETLEREGRIWLRAALSGADLKLLDEACAMGGAPGFRLRASSRLQAALEPVDRLASAMLPGSRPVRCVVFNKTEASNWSLPWHQDRVIAVRESADVEGFSNWTRKANVWHAEPPIELFETMIFARVHLDPANAENGCLELALGTHSHGRVAESDTDKVVRSSEIEPCVAARGDILFAKALILHRSKPSQNETDRRALRVDYSAQMLPAPLRWEFGGGA